MFHAAFLCLIGVACVRASTSPIVVASTIATSHTHHHTHHGHRTHTQYTGPTTTNEPNEVDNYRFQYDPHTHKMVLSNAHICYIVTLSDSEKAAIHTDVGVRTIELKILGTIHNSALPPSVTKDQVPSRLAHICGPKITAYYQL